MSFLCFLYLFFVALGLVSTFSFEVCCLALIMFDYLCPLLYTSFAFVFVGSILMNEKGIKDVLVIPAHCINQITARVSCKE